MTKISRRRKIASWESVKEKIEEMMENVPEHTAALSLPYGMQGLYGISHPEPVRILLHPSMNDYDTFVTHHGKAKKFYLNLWTVNQKDSQPEKKNTKVQLNYPLKHIVYVPTHRCFVAFATDLTLRVYATINFMEMSRVETSHSVLCLYHNACRDDVLAGCLGFVMIWKFPHAQSDPMFPTQKIECPAIHPDYWVTWIKVDKLSRQLLLNCEEAIVILDERSYQLKYNFKIDFRHSLPFTACAFYHPSCYFITGSKDYAVKVWNTSLNQCPLVTSFSGHCNAITALEVDIPHHLVISSSTDKTIRFWCLETFAQTYVLETGEEVHHMELMTLRRLFYQSHEHIRVWNLNHFHTLFTVLGFEIVTSRRVVSRGFPTRLLLQGKDGAIRIVSPSDGTIITTMFPLETLPEGIVDYAYNPREDRLYVVLSSGAILVFNTRTNPCNTYQLWKSDAFDGERVVSASLAESYGVSCITMMNVDEISVTTEDEIHHYTLLFAGLNNGHISLVYSNELSMHDTIEAHYGKIALLRASEGLNQGNSLYSAILVSCGEDCELKVWKIVFRNYSAKIISLELWSYVKLLSIPHDMETIGYTIGLVMDNNALMTCRVNPEAERPARSRHSHRDSLSRSGLLDLECSISTVEESHSKIITGLSACPTLGLFATSSDDWSVKIWNTEAKLLKEICFEESLRGVCFANTRGDLLVGFQSHISIVPLTNYLPLKILETLSTMDFPDDIFEHHLPFDRMLTFSYDPLRTPCLPLDLDQRRLVLQQDEHCTKTAPRIPSLFLLDYLTEDALDGEDTEPPPRRYSTTQEQEVLDEKIRKFQRSSMSRRSSAMHSPILEEVIARITQSFSSRSQMTTTKIEASSCDLVEQLRRLFDNDDSKIPDDYWPCAPDGYIPNSVVRQRVPPKEVPAHLIPRLMRGVEAQEWFKKTKKKSSKDDMGMPEDYYYPITLDDDELGFFSIFDGYNEGSYDQEKKSLLLDSSDEGEDEEEGLESSDDEMDLKKKWKASTIKTTMNKDQMLSSVRARQSVRDRKKVSKKPEMPMIIAAEEEEDINDVSKAEQAQETTESSNGKEEPEDETLQLPLVLRKVIDQPWFPKSSLVEGITVEDIFHEMISMMTDCAPLTYRRICDELIGLISCVGMSDEQKTKMLQVVVENLGHPAAGIRRASLKTVQELQVVSNQAIEGIISCLARGSQDLQQDALNALAQLLGVKDKEALRDLFIQINILSRTPSPESDVTPVHRPRTLSSKNIDLLGIEGEDGGMDKNKYIHEWLSGDESAVGTKTAESRSIFKKESREIKMASTIVSKMMFQKPEPRLSIVDLTFHDSSVSSRASSEVEEISSPPMEYTHDLIQKLQRTRAGCKLLSRLGYGSSPVDGSKDPIVNFEVPQKIEKVEKIEKNSKIEKRPPSALMGFAYGKVEKPYEREQGEWDEFDQGYERHRSMGHEQDMGGFPDINVSRVSSLSKRGGRQQEIQQEMDKTILPKILKRINTNRRNSTSGAVRRRNGRRVSLKQQYRFKLPGFDRKLPEWKTQAGASTQDEQQVDQPLQQQSKISKKAFDGQLPKQKRQIRGPIEGKQQVEQPGEQQDEISNKVQDENSARSGRHLTLDGKETTIDSRRRKSILRGLQRRRLEEELLASQLLTNHQQYHDSPLSSSLRVPTPSEENLLSPVSKRTNESAAEFHLPRIHLHPKHTETTKISRGVISDDITRGVLPTDTTRIVPGTNVPYSLHTEAETTKTSRGLKSDDITLGVLSTDTTRTVPGTNVPYSLYTDAETTKTSRDVISDEITRGVLSTDTNRIIPGTNVLYSLYTEADTTKTSRGAISDDITRGVFSADTTGIVPGTNVPYSLCTDIVGERLSQGTSVIARRPLGDLRINNEAVRVLRVNPKLTIDTGCNKWGRSRYGILEVVWTSRGIYDPQDFEISTVIKTRHHQTAVNEPTQALCVPTERIAVKKLLKPIRNRNLVTNPYTREAQQCFAKKLRKLPSISEGVPSATFSNSGSSREHMKPEHLCTVRELLEFDNRCLSRSN